MDGKVNGFAGARANATGRADLKGAGFDAEAFAGAKLEREGSVSVAGQKLKVSSDLQAGIGVTAKADFGMVREGGRDKLKIGGKIGGALGIGGTLGGGVELDVTPLMKAGRAVRDHLPGVKFLKSLGAGL